MHKFNCVAHNRFIYISFGFFNLNEAFHHLI